MRNAMTRFIGAIFVLFLFAGSTFAALTGNISGTVFDASGAVVPNAKVTVTNVDTGAVRVVSSSQSGEFSVPQLDIGTYKIDVDLAGFKTFTQSVLVRSGETTKVKVQMAVGTPNQTVTVEASAEPNLDATTAQVSDSLTSQAVISLPNQGRDPVAFTLLSPGMAPSQNNGFLGTGDYNSNGSRGRANNITVDGVIAVDISTTGESGIPMIPDTVQEFKTITNNFDAEFGRDSGSQVEVLTKSGTNAYHGSAYWYAQNTDFGNAAGFNFLPSQNPSSVTPIIQNQGGVTFGAPIIKDHTFFFGNWEVDRTRGAGAQVVANVLTPAQAAAITDPTDLKIFQQDGSPTSPSGTLAQSASNLLNQDTWSIRIDQNLRGGKDTLYVKYGQSPSTSTQGLGFINTFLAGFGTEAKAEPRDLSLGYTSTLSSSWVNTFNFGFGRSNPKFAVNSPFPITPQIDFGDGTSGFGESDIIPQGRTQNTFEYSDKLSWVTGRHTIKFGVDFLRYQAPSFFPAEESPSGDIQFASIADFQAGNALSFTQNIGPTTLHNFAFDAFGFAQDDFRVTPTLTLNLGVRLESSGGVSELRGLLANLDLNNHTPLGALGFGPLGGIDLGGTAFNRTYNPAPRLGFAWNPGNGKMVVRGGYGIAYDFIYQNPITNLRFSPPFVNQVQVNTPAESGPGDSLANLVAGTAPAQAAATAAIGHFNPAQINFGGSSPVAQNLQNPRNQQYDLGVEYQVMPNTVLKLTYVGAHNDRLQASQPINPVNPADIPAAPVSLADQNTRIAQFQAAFVAENGKPFGPASTRIDPRFNSVVQVQSTGTSSYNSMQLEAIRTFSHGLTFNANYTWAHSLDDVSDALNVLNFDSGSPLDPTKPLSFNRANSAFDVRNRFVVSYVYQLPNHFHGALHYLLDGWGQSSIFTAESGIPVTLAAPPIAGISDLLLDGDSNVSVDGNAAALHPQPFNVNFTEPAALPVSEPLLEHDGTSGRNQLYLNGLFNLDMTFMKNINVTESKMFQLRWEIYNTLNHPVFGGSGGYITNINSGIFNTYVATENQPRQMQLSLKFIF